MKKRTRHWIVAVILAILAANCNYTVIYRFIEPHPATRWLPLYDWIYNHMKE